MFSLMLKVRAKWAVCTWGPNVSGNPHTNPVQVAVALPFSVTSLRPNPRKSYSILADQLPNRPNSRPAPTIQPQRFWLPLHEPVPFVTSHGSANTRTMPQELALNWLVTVYLFLA